MSEPSKTITLPNQYRKPQPDRVETLKEIAVGQTRWVSLKAVSIDRNWGVWLDPNAEGRIWRERMTQTPGPIRVDKLNEGYVVYLASTDEAKNHKWEPGLADTHEGYFLPVFAVYS